MSMKGESVFRPNVVSDLDEEEHSVPGVSVDNDVAERNEKRGEAEVLRELIEAQHLPVAEHLDELKDRIKASIQGDGIMLLQGETGSGKSVYSPVAIREALRELGLPDRMIVMQPRRDATYLISGAVAAVMGEKLGEGVGFSTSEAKGVMPDTPVKVVTSGIFLRYLLEGNIDAEHIGAIMLDEIHENSIEYHLVLGLIKKLRAERKAPFVFLTSATPNVKDVQSFFGMNETGFMRIEGRSYPVEKRFVTSEQLVEASDEGRSRVRSYIEVAEDETRAFLSGSISGDVLVFLPGMREIEDFVARFRDDEIVEALPLHGMLGKDERREALVPPERRSGGKRRIIATTNIAETSVTVPGITHVVDSCRHKVYRFDPVSGIRKSQVEFISKAQAEQRAGRAGRLEGGTCTRLIPQRDFDSLPNQAESEIHRVNLSQVILTCKAVGIDPETFPFIEPPAPEKVRDGIEELKALGILDAKGELTDIGREAKDLPFEPHASRMIIEARRYGCVESALVIAALERERNVFPGPDRAEVENASGYDQNSKKIAARKAVMKVVKEQFATPGFEQSDLLIAFSAFIQSLDHGVIEAMRKDKSPEGHAKQKYFRQWCRECHVRPEALMHVAYRLMDFASYAGTTIDYDALKDQLLGTDVEHLGRILLAGYADRIYVLQDTGGYGMPEYRRHGDKKKTPVNISPGSVLFDQSSRSPEFVLSLEVKPGGKDFLERNYASGNHAVTLEQIYAVHPDITRLFEVQYLEKAWYASPWSYYRAGMVSVTDRDELPVPEETGGYEPQSYGNGLDGEDVYAHPALVENVTYSSSIAPPTFSVRYFPSKMLAEEARAKAELQFEAYKSGKEAGFLKKAQDMFASFGGILLSLESDLGARERNGISDGEALEIREKYDEAGSMRQAGDLSGMTRNLLWINNFLKGKREGVEEKKWAEAAAAERKVDEEAERSRSVMTSEPAPDVRYTDSGGIEIGAEVENRLAAAFLAAQNRTVSEEKKVFVLPSTPSVTSEGRSVNPEQDPDWILPDAERTEMLFKAELELVSLESIIKVFPKKPDRTGTNSREEKIIQEAHTKFQERRREALAGLRSLQGILGSYSRMTRRSADQLTGKMNSARQMVAALAKSRDLLQISSGEYKLNWYDDFSRAFESVKTIVDSDETVRELLPEERHEELIEAVRKRMIQSVGNAMRGKVVSVESLVEEELNKLI